MNKRVIFKDFVTGFPKVSDMSVTSNSMRLKLPQSSNAVLVKNLYLSCDPYMRMLMKPGVSVSATSYTPGDVISLDSPPSVWKLSIPCSDCESGEQLLYFLQFVPAKPDFLLILCSDFQFLLRLRILDSILLNNFYISSRRVLSLLALKLHSILQHLCSNFQFLIGLRIFKFHILKNFYLSCDSYIWSLMRGR